MICYLFIDQYEGDEYKLKTILICGATGFIGRNIVEHFAKREEYKVYAVYHEKEPFDCDNVEFLKADLREKEQVDKVVKGIDVIIQAAATTSGSKDIIYKPYIHVTDNAIMNSLIFRSAYEAKVKHIVFFSCGVMYQPSEIPRFEHDFNANDEIVPQYYGVGWTKVYIEKMCEFYSRISDTKYTVLRQSNIYGPYDKYDYEHSHMFGATLRKVMDAKEGDKIIVWGQGKESRDLLYVDDVVRFVDKAIDLQESKFVLCNVGYGQDFSVTEVVQKIISLSGKKLGIEYDVTKPSIPTHLSFNIERAMNLFGWKPQTSFEDGIKKTILWYQKTGG